MRFKKIYIDGYKNLKETSIEVQSADIPLAIIGNNGTGKSNLIEALLQVFVGLYRGSLPDFSFGLEYEANGKNIAIAKVKGEKGYAVWVDGNQWTPSKFIQRIQETEQMPPFPSLVFCYYSGTCGRTKDFIKKYNRSYQIKLANLTEDLQRLFVFSDIDQAEWCLLGLFAHRNSALLKRLSLGSMNECKITLKPPKTYSPERDEPLNWGTKGALRDFMADLEIYAPQDYKALRDDVSLGSRELRTHVLNVEQLEKVGTSLERRGTNLFSMLQLIDAKHMLHQIDFNVIHETSKAQFGVDDLSEGEKQLLCVLGGLSLSNQTDCLVLLDEPDTHLNPNWSWEYESMLREALKEKQQNNTTVILATHDPVVISGLLKEQVLIAHEVDGRLTYEQPYRDPRGQGVANVLTSEYFGLPSSLDKYTQSLLDERLYIAMKSALTKDEKNRLSTINKILDSLGLSISFRDPEDVKSENKKYQGTRKTDK